MSLEFKEGMICFSGGNGIMQRLIRFFTRSDFSHSFTVMSVDGVISALETTSTVVVCKPVEEKYSEKNWIECWELVDPQDQADMFLRALTVRSIYEGEWYAYQSYVFYMYAWVCGLFGYTPTKMWSWCSKFLCFVITCTELTGYTIPRRLLPDNDLNYLTPEILRNHFINNPRHFRKVGWIIEKVSNG